MFSNQLKEQYPEAITFLTNAIRKNKLANSYILIGKDSDDLSCLVINLAQILNCEQNKDSYSLPCNSCINCKWLKNNEHPQALLTISPEDTTKKEQIKIDTIRELLSTLKTTSDFFRVIFFQKSNLRYLPKDACNLLLKTVEETPQRTIFIFSDSSKNDILPTILSRSQIIYLNKKYNLLKEIVINKDSDSAGFIPDNSSTALSSLENAKKAIDYINQNEISLKEFLNNLAITDYEKNKYSDLKSFCILYNKLNTAYLKHNSFMNLKIILEDLFYIRK